jgi:predicted aspartyl protease
VRSNHVWIFGAVAMTVLVVALLGRWRRHDQRVVFPSSPPITRLAIRAPLVRPDLSVTATLHASERRTSPVWMTVDSGATGVTLPTETFYSLGLDALRGVTVRIEDPSGRVFERDAGELPHVSLGPLVVDDVVVALGGSATVLGQSVLAHAPWEIDWDRGLLVLGATPWEGGTATLVPLRKMGDADVVTVHIDGAPIDMVLDTGAFASTLPDPVGTTAGLSSRRLPPTVLHSLGGEVLVRRVFAGNARLGALSLGRMEMGAIASGGRRAALGLLGLDVLSRFHLQVVPGRHLALRPREDVRATRSERIGRWSFVPTSCEHAGCVHATLAPAGEDAKLSVTLEADLDRSVEVLLGCAGDHGDTVVPTGSSFGFGDPVGVARHVRTRLASRARGSVTTAIIPRGAHWFESGGAECRSLEALDVSPLSPTANANPDASSKEADDLQASYWP